MPIPRSMADPTVHQPSGSGRLVPGGRGVPRIAKSVPKKKGRDFLPGRIGFSTGPTRAGVVENVGENSLAEPPSAFLGSLLAPGRAAERQIVQMAPAGLQKTT